MSFNSFTPICSGISSNANVGLAVIIFRSLSRMTIITRKGSL